MNIITKTPRVFSPTRCVLAVAVALATSQAASKSVLEEVTVTAQKREQSLQDVGIAITTFSGEQMNQLGVENSVDIAKFTSSVSISGSFAGQMSQFSVRGVTQNDFNDHVEAPNAVYIDEGYVAMQQGQMFSTFDIERVEVLKGPQGTLFGRNATGGLIHFISKKPTEETEGYLDVTYGDYNQTRFEGAISGALTDGVTGRLSGMYNKYDEYVDNKYPGQTFTADPTLLHADPSNPSALNNISDNSDLGNDETWALRGQLLFDVGDSSELHLIAFATETETSIGAYQSAQTIATLDANGEQIGSRYTNSSDVCELINSSGGCADTTFDGDGDGTRPVPGGDFWGYIDPDGNDFDTSSDFAFDDFNSFETQGVTVKFTTEFDGFNLTSVTDYKEYEKFVGLDLEGAPVNQFIWLQSSEEETFTQEFRLDGSTDSMRWVTGFYYLYIDNENVSGLSGLPNNVAGFGSFDEPREAELETKSYSLFGQVDIDLGDTFTLVSGLRVTREEKEYQFNVGFVLPSPVNFVWDPLTAPIVSFNDETSDTLITGKLQLDWKPNDDLLVYAGINRGVKAGSFNSGGSSIAPATIPYDEEVLTAYEIGFKSTIFDGAARFNGAVYYYDYKDYQAARWLGFANLITNNDASTVGAEMELITSPTDNLDVLLTVGIFDAEVEDVQVTSTLTRDVQPTFAPEKTASALVRYSLPNEILNGTLALQADVTYQSETYHNLTNFDSTKMDSYTLGNLRASWVSSDEIWSLDVFVNNVTDERYNTVGFDLSQVCGCNEEAQGKPRWWGISTRYNF